MKNILCLSSVFALSFSAEQKVFAFWDQSHQLISEVASQKVSKTTSIEMQRLLHIKIYYPGSEKLSANTSDFDTAASWADNIKNYSNQKINKKLSLCHYVDIPLSKDMIRKKINENEAINKLNEVLSSNPDNSVSCLKSFIKTLLSTKETDVNKAISLRMLMHIIGDFGQPLHNSALIEGSFDDAGGNKILIENNITFLNIDNSSSNVNNLHKVWDGSLGVYLQFPYNKKDSTQGNYTNEERTEIKKEASKILSSNSFLEMLETLPNSNDEISLEKWAIDSYKVAVTSAYSEIDLKNVGSTMSASFTKGYDFYKELNKEVLNIQIKKSSIRLMNILNAIFDPSSIKNQYSILIENIQNDEKIKPFIISKKNKIN